MRKLIAAINMTLDGVCDHTAGIPDEEIHQHYADLLRNAGVVLYGRTTFQLMKYWQTIAANPTGTHATDDFAVVMDQVPKRVFSHTLKQLGWASAQLATQPLAEEVVTLKQQAGKDLFVGSRSLIVQLLKLRLIDELQLCVYPVVAGNGLPLFEDVNDRMMLTLVDTKVFRGGAIVLYYRPSEPEAIPFSA
ncbi:dihydrofolate reductase [Hymenobacter sediminis]|uniref:dihydrofolate reductase family protein n=1 Tax=Hymenobacter sediminis TaxID=2218621 RepID=UPI000DA686CD|nr:dihydrofolate reductase family protein [Hymenobacter sediminis]RPD43655.1 dihydrofolate reductase [Hymenobacter sediminis]